MVVGHRVHVRARHVDGAVQDAFGVHDAAALVDGIPLQRELHDVLQVHDLGAA